MIRLIISTAMVLTLLPAAKSQNQIVTHSITLRGNATGGQLVFSARPPANVSVRIPTRKGQPAEQVVRALVEALNENENFLNLNGQSVKADGAKICNLGGYAEAGLFFFGGTECGLGIPKSSPSSLSVVYDFKADKIRMSWDLTATYDSVGISVNGHGMPNVPGKGIFKRLNNVSRYPMLYPVNDMVVCVVGYKKGVPSNASLMRLKGNRQEEIPVPFSNGIMPNWQHLAKGDMTKPTVRETTNHEQVVTMQGKTDSSTYSYNMWRTFSGLDSNAQYRLGIDFRLPKGSSPVKCQFLVAPLSDAKKFSQADLLPAEVPGLKLVFDWTNIPSEDWRSYKTGTRTRPNIKMHGKSDLLCWIRIEGEGLRKVECFSRRLYLERVHDVAK